MQHFEAGSIVRVARQPSNQIVTLVDEVGFIEKLRDDAPGLCDFQALKVTGERSGWGTVPLDCLALETGQQWRTAYERFKAEQARYEQYILARSKRINDAVKLLAQEHGITEAAVHAIYQTMCSVYDE